ncbi:MAG: nitroreductase [Proteobacteria bacterium]|nr:nitroreductase [Pseudomonadota bacterium]
MDVFTAIRTRRSDGQVLADKPVNKTDIEKLLEAAGWAPNHHRTEPWRFAVFSGTGRKKLAAALATSDEDMADALKKVMRAPVVITVWAATGRGQFKNPPVWEDHAAVAAACQNIVLAAHALGLAAIWRSGGYVDATGLHDLLELDTAKGDRVMGFIYVGHHDPERPEPMRPDPKTAERTLWFDAE